MPSVVRLSIAPVRSLGLEHPEEIDVTERGVPEDRRFFLADDANRLVDRLIVGSLVRVSTHTEAEVSSTYLINGPRASGDSVTGTVLPVGPPVRTTGSAKSGPT